MGKRRGLFGRHIALIGVGAGGSSPILWRAKSAGFHVLIERAPFGKANKWLSEISVKPYIPASPILTHSCYRGLFSHLGPSSTRVSLWYDNLRNLFASVPRPSPSFASSWIGVDSATPLPIACSFFPSAVIRTARL
jgi:hypothetical protein